MRILSLWLGLAIVLSGCSENEIGNTKTNGLEVIVTSNPIKVKLLEPVKITAVVKNDGVEISEPAEVEFELIKKDRARIGSVRPDNIGAGKYQIETIFDEEGVYQIVSHVTLGSDHVMPTYEIDVSP